MKIAVKFEIIKGHIQLFDKNGEKLDGKGTKWEGDFYCSHNQLTSLEGAPESVGGDFSCYSNQLTSLEGAPKEHQPMFSAFLSAGFVFCDNILTRKKSSKKFGVGLTLYKTERLGFKKNAPIVYVISDGTNHAHGDTIEAAMTDFTFKTANRDLSRFKNLPDTTKKTVAEWAVDYRIITGACQFGVESFIKQQGKMKKSYTLKEIIKITDGAYGHDKFVQAVA